jgi:hypothetical protein
VDEQRAGLPAEIEGDEAHWDAWPCCPQCGQRRQTRCPTCELGGQDFPLADCLPAAENLPAAASLPASDACGGCGCRASGWEAAEVLLVCTGCQDVFAPEFYRVCPQCGHDFGEGLVARDAEDPREFSGRVLWTVFGMLVVVAIALAYFAYVTAG